MKKPWPFYATPQDLDTMVERIASATKPEKIILFGSYARGNPGPDSDVDFLVIESQDFGNSRPRNQELKKIRHVLRGTLIPKDILVYSKKEVASWSGVLNHVIGVALKEGRVVYEKH